MQRSNGVVAAGHPRTAQVAGLILEHGGNAFDAALGALAAACVVEPVLASLAGGGFLLAHSNDGRNTLYDFFAQTPLSADGQDDVDFFPIVADFGPVQQEFHIGVGSIATPGVVKGIFEVHRDLGSLPLAVILEPAITMAREGEELNAFQSQILEIVGPIYESNPTAHALYASPSMPGLLAREGDRIQLPELADTLEALVREGDSLFYQGEIGQRLVNACEEHGGLLRGADLASYRVARRKPLTIRYGNARILSNPPPSVGGLLICFGLRLLQELNLRDHAFGSEEHVCRLVEVMASTQQARLAQGIDQSSGTDENAHRMLEDSVLTPYRDSLRNRLLNSRGTTQISVIDSSGDVASLTVSNGEGSGFVIPGTGVMTNNMLGEADLHPHGFHNWTPDRRIVSMMAPSVVLWDDGRMVGTGSGGSNRIRTAILQVLCNLLEFGMDVKQAVYAPRVHFEDDILNVEGGFASETVATLSHRYPNHKFWPDRHLFFGGAHTVMRDAASGRVQGTGDPRRGGDSVFAEDSSASQHIAMHED